MCSAGLTQIQGRNGMSILQYICLELLLLAARAAPAPAVDVANESRWPWRDATRRARQNEEREGRRRWVWQRGPLVAARGRGDVASGADCPSKVRSTRRSAHGRADLLAIGTKRCDLDGATLEGKKSGARRGRTASARPGPGTRTRTLNGKGSEIEA